MLLELSHAGCEDRHSHLQVDFEIEDCHWVPKAAIDAMLNLIAQFPDVPTAPFLNLLTQLNKIWRKRGLQQVQEAQHQHEKDLVDFQRSSNQATPYQQKVMHQRLNHLKKELKLSRMSMPKICFRKQGNPEAEIEHLLQMNMPELCPSIGSTCPMNWLMTARPCCIGA